MVVVVIGLITRSLASYYNTLQPRLPPTTAFSSDSCTASSFCRIISLSNPLYPAQQVFAPVLYLTPQQPVISCRDNVLELHPRPYRALLRLRGKFS